MAQMKLIVVNIAETFNSIKMYSMPIVKHVYVNRLSNSNLYIVCI